jgi:hypothetical protein
LGDLRLGELGATRRVGPGGGRGAGHRRDHFDPGHGVLGALLIAAQKLAHQRNVHPADEAHLAALAGQRRHHADQEAAFVFAVDEALHVGQRHHHVDDGKALVWEGLGHGLDAAGLRKTDAHDRVGTFLGEAPGGLLALRGVLHFEFEIGFARLGLPALGTLVRRLVERTVELAAEFVDDGRLGLHPTGAGQHPGGRHAQHAHLRTWP